MKKILILLVMIFVLFGCKKNKSIEQDFLKNLTNIRSYKAEGLMETFYDDDRKQSEFTVLYKSPDLYKVVIKNVESEDQQIILKNKDGVHVLIPSVNKTFKINSNWPNSSSYPYLLQSLAKDIANEENIVKITNEKTTEIETDTFMHTNKNIVKQKIIFDNETLIPSEVKVYNKADELYIRVLFENIELDYNINDEEFKIDSTIAKIRESYGEEGIVFSDRAFSMPGYFPEGSSLNSQITNSQRAIMKFSGTYGFTIIQEYVDDAEVISSWEEEGSAVLVFGSVGVLTDHYLKFVYEGIIYTLASQDINVDELMKVAASYMVPSEK